MIEVDESVVRVALAEQGAYVLDAMERDAHGDLELTGGQIDVGDHLRARVLDLEARIELEEAVGVRVRVVEVLDGAGRHVADHLGESDGVALHALEYVLVGDGGGRLLDDLLVAALDGAVAAEERYGVAVVVRQYLHFDVARVRRILHDEYGRAGHLGLHLPIGVDELLLGVDLADAFAAAALARLHHERVADVARSPHALLGVVHARLLVHELVDGAEATGQAVGVRPGDGEARAGPGQRGHARRLRHYARGDLVAERPHGLLGRSDERDAVAVEQLRQLGILGGVAPAGPHGLHRYALGNVEYEVAVGVVVVVRAAGHGHAVVGDANVLGVGLEVLGRVHDDELDGALVAEDLVGPAAYAAHALDGGDAVVGDEHGLDHPVAVVAVHEVVGRGEHGRGEVAAPLLAELAREATRGHDLVERRVAHALDQVVRVGRVVGRRAVRRRRRRRRRRVRMIMVMQLLAEIDRLASHVAVGRGQSGREGVRRRHHTRHLLGHVRGRLGAAHLAHGGGRGRARVHGERIAARGRHRLLAPHRRRARRVEERGGRRVVVGGRAAQRELDRGRLDNASRCRCCYCCCCCFSC